LASTIQYYGVNWLGQACNAGPCFHPQFLGLGLILLAIAFLTRKIF
jgi:hypothetical protein